MLKKTTLIFALLITPVFSFANTTVLMSTGRSQNINNCWAHAGAFMAESAYENATQKTAITEIGSDLQMLNVYSRLMYVYESQKRFSNDELGDETGYVGEYLEVLQRYGLLVRESGNSEAKINYAYPAKINFTYEKTDHLINFRADWGKIQDQLLAKGVTPEQADKIIRQAILKDTNAWVPPTTKLAGEEIKREELFERLIPSALRPQGKDPISVFVTSKEIYPKMPVGFVQQDNILAFVVPKTQDIIDLAKVSLDHGYVPSYETPVHAMAMLGYTEYQGKTYYAIANSAGNISWTPNVLSGYGGNKFDSSTLFYNVIKDDLKKFLPFSMVNRPYLVSGVFKPRH